MRTEKGVIIAAYKPKEPPRFIALKRKKNWEGWELPKGQLEEDDHRKTVKIELEEETGIEEDQIEDIEDMDCLLEWSFEDDGEEVEKKYRGFLVRLSEDANVSVIQNPHDEHEAGFFFRYRDVEKMLTYEDQVEFLEKAREEVKR